MTQRDQNDAPVNRLLICSLAGKELTASSNGFVLSQRLQNATNKHLNWREEQMFSLKEDAVVGAEIRGYRRVEVG